MVAAAHPGVSRALAGCAMPNSRCAETVIRSVVTPNLLTQHAS
ncbi:hypothetical protein ACFPIJ_00165 [Dactylosporangium cerinum]|uniref:Uncharacterized protein n=1 Tax=Dactylosporangium cerinum TaxID=1434730 RepID=A0ABV9VKY8_9ACTN